MRQSIDYLKTWSAMRGQERGIVNYDRLAKAGLPGSIVLHNILGTVLESATVQNRERVEGFDGAQREVELGRGGTISYLPGGPTVSKALVLLARVRNPDYSPMATATALVSYQLSNEPEQEWQLMDGSSQDENPHIRGTVSGPYRDLEGRVTNDFNRALTDPVQFVLAASERVLDVAGVRVLSSVLQAPPVFRAYAELNN